MVNIDPIVRHMILADNVSADSRTPPKIGLHGLIQAVHLTEPIRYPATIPTLCVLLYLAGGRGQECWSDYARKLATWNADPARIQKVVAELAFDGVALAASVPSPSSLSAGLRAAGSPAAPDDLVEWVTPQIWRWAIANCHFMRDRFTVVDLLFLLGWWTPADIDSVIAHAVAAEKESVA